MFVDKEVPSNVNIGSPEHHQDAANVAFKLNYLENLKYLET